MDIVRVMLSFDVITRTTRISAKQLHNDSKQLLCSVYARMDIVILIASFPLMTGIILTALQMDDEHYAYATLPPTYPAYNGSSAFFTFGFDHAYISQYTNGYSYMQSHGNFPATMYIVTSKVNTTDHMNFTNLQTLHNAGWELSSHSVDHTAYLQYPANVTIQVYDSKGNMTKWNYPPQGYIPPNGQNNQTLVNLVKAANYNYTMLLPSEPMTMLIINNDAKNIHMLALHTVPVGILGLVKNNTYAKLSIDNAVKNKQWLIFNFHHIDNVSNDRTSPALFDYIVNYVQNQTIAGNLTVTTQAEGLGLAKQAAAVTETGSAYKSKSGVNSLNSTKYREWISSSSSWTSEVELPTIRNPIKDAVLAYDPTGNWSRTIFTHSQNGSLNLFFCRLGCNNTASWQLTGNNIAATGSTNSSAPYKPFNMAYEHKSGKLVIVYDKVSPSKFFYRTFLNGVLSGENGINYTGDRIDHEIRYFEMEQNPSKNSNELSLIIEDATVGKAYAFIWNGTTFGNQKTVTGANGIGTTSLFGDAIGVAYENKDGKAVFASGNGTDSVTFTRWNGVGYDTSKTFNPSTSITGKQVKFLTFRTNPAAASNFTQFCELDNKNNIFCIADNNYNFGAWVKVPTAAESVNSRPMDYQWNPSNNVGLFVWATSTSNQLSANTFNATSGHWGTTFTISTVKGLTPWIDANSNLNLKNGLASFWLKQNSTNFVGSLKYDGTTLGLISDSSHSNNNNGTISEAMSLGRSQ
ncbi:MAG TPA: polysaccharide deacetylase family protein [Nitrosopumilaceae archaeon]|nr:polysaccharide deacetylase family protein [Nitrosopumilaceae archaeon]